MSCIDSAKCPRKANARDNTIIKLYRKFFQYSLPSDKEYWTLAGPCYDGETSEPFQVRDAGLITLSQYHGIDNSKDIIRKNQQAIPDANFHYGDFVEEMLIAESEKRFSPGIINADYTNMVKYAVSNTGEILHLLHRASIKDIMLLVNYPINNSRQGVPDYDIESLENIANEHLFKFKSNQKFKNYFNAGGWKTFLNPYFYHGTGDNSRTVMMSMAFYR